MGGCAMYYDHEHGRNSKNIIVNHSALYDRDACLISEIVYMCEKSAQVPDKIASKSATAFIIEF